jgi:predicted TIM-barrel fold metal-dependent hydrolase
MRGERCFFTFDPDEQMLPEAMRSLGTSRLMWASDYPHFDAEFPDAAEIVVNNPRLSAEEKRAILADNALRFFRRIAESALPTA